MTKGFKEESPVHVCLCVYMPCGIQGMHEKSFVFTETVTLSTM